MKRSIPAFQARFESVVVSALLVPLTLVILVAMSTVGRHVIEIDDLRAPTLDLLGLAAIVLALAVGCFPLRRSHPSPPAASVEVGRGKSTS